MIMLTTQTSVYGHDIGQVWGIVNSPSFQPHRRVPWTQPSSLWTWPWFGKLHQERYNQRTTSTRTRIPATVEDPQDKTMMTDRTSGGRRRQASPSTNRDVPSTIIDGHRRIWDHWWVTDTCRNFSFFNCVDTITIHKVIVHFILVPWLCLWSMLTYSNNLPTPCLPPIHTLHHTHILSPHKDNTLP